MQHFLFSTILPKPSENLPKIGLLALASLLITVLLVFLLRYIAHIVIYFIMAIAALGSIAITTFLWLRFVETVKSGSSVTTVVPVIGIEMQVSTTFLVYAILMSILTVILLLGNRKYRKRVTSRENQLQKKV